VKDRFIAYIQFEKRYSQHTITAYRNDLDQFLTFIDSQYHGVDIREVSHPLIRSWIVRLMEEGLSSRSINRKITTLKSYFKFLLKEGVVEENPMRKVISPRNSKRLPVFVEKDKMGHLLDQIESSGDFPALRDRVVIELFYATGMRLSELITIEEKDIDFHQCMVKVTGKRNKERLIPFSNKIRDLLHFYLKEKAGYLAEMATTSKVPVALVSYLIIRNTGQQIYPRMVYRIVKQYLSQVTTTHKKSPHILRHTFATHLLNNGAELNAVKELLGHANLAATQVYTHNTIEKLKTVYKQAHPKA
jgi:integrase/recombinase XerC